LVLYLIGTVFRSKLFSCPTDQCEIYTLRIGVLGSSAGAITAGLGGVPSDLPIIYIAGVNRAVGDAWADGVVDEPFGVMFQAVPGFVTLQANWSCRPKRKRILAWYSDTARAWHSGGKSCLLHPGSLTAIRFPNAARCPKVNKAE